MVVIDLATDWLPGVSQQMRNRFWYRKYRVFLKMKLHFT
jgi:hypothetical protein